MFSSRATLPIFLAAGVAAASSCATAGTETTLERRVVTLRPTRTGAVRHIDGSTFGTCVGLERRGRSSAAWGHFLTLADAPELDGMAGYEVAIARGETCHLRVISHFQTLAEFDIASLPSGAVQRAALRAVPRLDRMTDAPVPPGTRDQCDILTVGRVTSSWSPGTSTGSLIDWSPIPPPPAEFGRYARFDPVDVTRAVRAWHDGSAPNIGFVVTPRPDSVRTIAAGIEEEQDSFVCDLMLGQFELDVTMLVR